MRPLLAVAILLVGLRSAAPEAKFQDALPDPDTIYASFDPETVFGKSDRAPVEKPARIEASDTAHDQDEQKAAPPSPNPASTDASADADVVGSLEGLCKALMTAAQDYQLPVPFFANLIWQESRLQHDAVSKVGAQGIAQFMPEVAAEEGVGDPFDPRQAIPASARLLHALREHFGNLGLAAAAYNAGAHRVGEWLDRHRALPAETRNYVVRVTGRSIEAWRKSPVEDSRLTFVRLLPCRQLPAFAELEHSQLQETQPTEETKTVRHKQQAATRVAKPAAKISPTAARKTARTPKAEASVVEPVVAEGKAAHKLAHATVAGATARSYHGNVHAVSHRQRPARERRREA
ncbi:MAG: lytic transglycosylase domain-containing protein [Hyphomicrobiales bacterium]|nr:lytic transglycosylase domain-containing protein [Hyphomicrobiales bacterium]